MASELKNNNILYVTKANETRVEEKKQKKQSFRFLKHYNGFTLIRSSVAKSQNARNYKKNTKKSSRKALKI